MKTEGLEVRVQARINADSWASTGCIGVQELVFILAWALSRWLTLEGFGSHFFASYSLLLLR